MGLVHSADKRALGGKEVLGADDVVRSLTRIVLEIIERNGDTEGFAIAGVLTHGTSPAKHLVERISEVDGLTAECAIIDPAMLRGDLADKPLCTLKSTPIPPTRIDGRTVIFVDDVLHTGRTIKAALDALGGIGRLSRVQLAILVDYEYRELPIRPDYADKDLPTSHQEIVIILLKEDDGHDDVPLGKEN